VADASEGFDVMTLGNGTYLDRIIAQHRKRASADQRSLADLQRAVKDRPPPRKFLRALEEPGLSVIAEIKRRSPSKGDLSPDLDPRFLAGEYEAGGASCLSVLTDSPNFGGSPTDLTEARDAVSLPVLRKDFTVDERDLLDALLMGADAVLLIAAALSGSELRTFGLIAQDLGLNALVEVHDERELDQALEIGSDLIGVNQRDLYTFEVDHERAARMASLIPAEVVGVAESGVRGPEDAAVLHAEGYSAVLVGESLVTSGDPALAVSALKGTS